MTQEQKDKLSFAHKNSEKAKAARAITNSRFRSEEENQRISQSLMESQSFLLGRESAKQKMANPFTLINPEGEEITEPSINEFCRKYNLERGQLRALKQGKKAQYKDWTLPPSVK